MREYDESLKEFDLQYGKKEDELNYFRSENNQLREALE